jgi:hypothetical protein
VPGGRVHHLPAAPGTHEKKPSKTLPNGIFKIFVKDSFHPIAMSGPTVITVKFAKIYGLRKLEINILAKHYIGLTVTHK